jgi:signal transduction histidine kinase
MVLGSRQNRRHLFERVTGLERHDSIIRRGSGISLALTKELVDLHKGKIIMKAKKTKVPGLSFCFPLVKIIGPMIK